MGAKEILASKFLRVRVTFGVSMLGRVYTDRGAGRDKTLFETKRELATISGRALSRGKSRGYNYSGL